MKFSETAIYARNTLIKQNVAVPVSSNYIFCKLYCKNAYPQIARATGDVAALLDELVEAELT